jgi:lipoprotein signal peptidase
VIPSLGLVNDTGRMTSPPAQGGLLGSALGGSGRRLRLLLLVAVMALVLDQSAKLVAGAVHPAGYAQNPSLLGSVWPTFAFALLVCLLPYRPLAVTVGLCVGGASGNLLDHYLWPGGTPDFISISWLFPDAVWNPADLLIVIGTLGVAVALLFWPLHAAVRQWRQTADHVSVSSS